ncbi:MULTISPECIES: DUF3986 family protein [Bacillus]|uniref:DUF3986 family protein n=1 Tax=Bacillus TaxID=1386 RepID=UPI000FF25721|nr:DUF3986 family protein [Bacillus safensis]MCY1091600.1 DUF3986 family protein [Bacillus safensis]RKE71677.1 uncharacterized protein DUF3986 [Bacillus safensis]GLF87505.1 hypothetical protein R51_25500 [Bacillus safensis]
MCTDERIHRLDESMHVHVGYYEQGCDYEGVFFKSLETGRWLLFFDQKSYGLNLLKSYEEYDHLGLFIGEYSIEDAQIEEKGQQLFECFLKENGIVE